MKRIYKGQPPSSLIQHKAQKGATYSNYSKKEDLRKSLLNEQGYICCYCMKRIYADEKTIEMKIEHWASQKHHAHRQLEHTNLLGACMGNEGARPKRQHCDTRKGETDIAINPADSKRNCELLFHYSSNGEIHSDDDAIEKDLNETLNLNLTDLVKARKEALAKVVEKLSEKFPGKTWSAAAIQKELDVLKTPQGGMFDPFCQYITCYLERRL